MPDAIYYKLMGEVIGPLTLERFKREVSAGNVTLDTHVRVGENGDWVFARSIPNLFDQERRKPSPPVDPSNDYWAKLARESAAKNKKRRRRNHDWIDPGYE